MLHQNICLNDFSNKTHLAYQKDVLSTIDQFIKDKISFDFIICDPPSASSDGKRVTSALKNYDELLPKLSKLLNPNGQVVAFLNTHTINWNKFEKQMVSLAQKSKLKKMRRFNLGEDCRSLKGFQEGDYLKEFCLKGLEDSSTAELSFIVYFSLFYKMIFA